MRSDLPKVLHPLAGRPLLQHVLERVLQLQPEGGIHLVHGHGGEQLRQRFDGYPLRWVLQQQQLGTGHAVAQALPGIDSAERVVVLYGDVPLISLETLQRLLAVEAEALGLLTVTLEEPYGYGRIVRDPTGGVARIVEQCDGDEETLQLREVNTGVMVAPRRALQVWIDALESDNAQGEFYLTDVVEQAVASGVKVTAVEAGDAMEVQGVNDRVQLARLERHLQQRQAERLLQQGVTLQDPARFDLRGELRCDRDVVIDLNVLFEGKVVLGEGVRIGSGCVIRNTTIAAGSEILPYCHIDGAEIGAGCRVGPFARLRPGTVLHGANHVGNFVEIKQGVLGHGSKANHLSYIGDSMVGQRVNIGAGVITCNYDGAYKHQTVIGDDVFIGSDTQLVAPVEVESGATIGAGSTIVKRVVAAELTLSRSKQVTVKGWKRPVKEQG